MIGQTFFPQNKRDYKEEIEILTKRIDALQSTSVGMDVQEFLRMTPVQQQTWLEYYNKNKHRVGII